MKSKGYTPKKSSKRSKKKTGVYTMSVDNLKLIKHVKKVCKPNLERDAKICKNCPFSEDIKRLLKIMQ